MKKTGCWVGLAWLAACTPDGAPPATEGLSVAEQGVIYGTDDRTDWYAVEDPALRALTTNAIVAYVSANSVDLSDPDDVGLPWRTLVETSRLCPDERFVDQPTAASCSATLIDDDLVLTAGHCVDSQRACTSARFVFRYYMESESELATIEAEDVYSCAEVVVQRLTNARSGTFDHGIVRLDRPATPRHQPAAVAPRGREVAVGDPVTIIGFGSGLPAKIDTGGRVTSVRSQGDYFEATTDSFGGNSGSGVFNADNEVIGILVRGQQDYRFDGRCMRATTYPEDGGRFGAEGISFARQAIDELCDGGWVSPRLCGNEVVCGDGVCSPGETGCVEDCGSGVPAAWSCDPGFWGTEDGCDCDCGAYDPDCDDPAADVLNCEAGEVCLADGTCGTDDEVVEEPLVDVPEEWVCDPVWYDARDGCDCDCGAYDPDCDVADQQLINCLPGQLCSADGVCVDDRPPEPDDEADAGDADATGGEADGEGVEGSGDSGGQSGRGTSGCASVPEGPAGPWGLVGAACAVLVTTRRRQSASARTAR